jgi:hypothetical protein
MKACTTDANLTAVGHSPLRAAKRLCRQSWAFDARDGPLVQTGARALKVQRDQRSLFEQVGTLPSGGNFQTNRLRRALATASDLECTCSFS